MKCPDKQDWLRIAAEFEDKWNFPNCVGAVDGKHIVIKCPPKSGSMFFNYKSSYSIVLLAAVDANYCFEVIDVGGYGKQADGGTFAASEFGRRFNTGQLDLPEPTAPPGCCTKLPFVFVADEAFPLTPNMMRPFPGKKVGRNERIFNYRLSRARRIVENAFGILATRFRVFHRTMDQKPQTVDKIVKATCVLHNLLQMGVCSAAISNDEIDHELLLNEDNSTAFRRLPTTKQLRASNEAFEIRNKFRDYFISPAGEVSWQTDM
jgi:hypothetical protein